MDILMAVLSVLAILALIVVAGFIIYALADLVIAIIEKKNGNVFGKDKKKSKDKFKYNASLELDDDEKFLLSDEDAKMIEYKEEPEETNEKEEDDSIIGVNDAEAERERLLVRKSNNSDVDWFKNGGKGDYQSIIREERKKMLEEKENKLNKKVLEEEENLVDEPEEQTEEQKDEEIVKNINRTALEKLKEEKEAEKQFEDDEFEDIFLDEDDEDEEVEEDATQDNVEEVEEELEENVIQPIVLPAVDDAKISEYEQKVQELEQKLKQQLEENEKIKKLAQENEAKLLAEQENIKSTLEAEKSKSPLEYDEDLLKQYEAKLETLLERQKLNDKEYKQNKKEFQPLNRIKSTLAKDQDKLRRKEAIVAKQKIMLFGVNNSDGVDEEKAKKLDEEIDLLEGLRLSVQHCETVMQENKDRFPILEKANRILLTNKEQIASDIAEVEKFITEMKNLKK